MQPNFSLPNNIPLTDLIYFPHEANDLVRGRKNYQKKNAPSYRFTLIFWKIEINDQELNKFKRKEHANNNW